MARPGFELPHNHGIQWFGAIFFRNVEFPNRLHLANNIDLCNQKHLPQKNTWTTCRMIGKKSSRSFEIRSARIYQRGSKNRWAMACFAMSSRIPFIHQDIIVTRNWHSRLFPWLLKRIILRFTIWACMAVNTWIGFRRNGKIIPTRN